ncbi:MAG: DNA internalization-related competence protein ComEC/Rec2 [Deltaproteobacteria bacterium]|nr:DNA internalization-related competence protein ComEC/Rec2 [Deltaproteobacteria bacterium]
MRPLVPVFLAFAAGIVFSYRLGLSREAAYLILAASSIPIILSIIKGRRFDWFISAPLFFFIGALFIMPYIRPELPANHIRNFVSEARSHRDAKDGALKLGLDVEGVVLRDLEYAGERVRLHIGSRRIFHEGEWRDTSGTVLLTVQGHPGVRIRTGDSVRFLSPLKEPWRYGNPGEFDYKRWLNQRGIFVTGFLKNPNLLIKTGEGGSGPWGYIEAVRDRIRESIDASGVKNGEALKALIISEQAGISRDVKDAFVKTGTWHVISISGLHVGVVALFSYWVFIFILKRSERVMLAFNIRKAAMLLALAPVLFYGFLAGMPVPTQRSVIMATVFVFTYIINRGRDFFNTLTLSAVVILLIAPYSLWDVSFQLTFASLGAIVYLEPRLKGFFEREKGVNGPLEKEGRIKAILRKRVLPTCFATVAAGIGTFPILAYQFHRVSLTGLAANVIAVPLTGMIAPLLMLHAALNPLWYAPALIILKAADWAFELTVIIVKFFAVLPYSSVWVSTPTLFEIAVFYALVLCAVNLRRGRVYRYAAVFLVAVSLADIAYWGRLSQRDKRLKVTFISVGQGDSALIEFPDGETMIVDGGGRHGNDYDIGEGVVAPFLWSKKIKKIDYMVLSHAQLDHMGGLKFLAENFKVGEFWWNNDGDLGGLGEALSRADVVVKTVDSSTGAVDVGGALVEVENPPGDLRFDQNDNSVVLRVGYGDRSFLFTGDIGAQAEEGLSRRDISSTVLKAPHHGSRWSSTSGFLRKAAPSYVVVSAGRDNVFGFPHEEALKRYDEAGAKVYRTDVDGAVAMTTDGKDLRITPYLTHGEP